MNTLSLRTWVRNAAAVFSGAYGAVTRQAEMVGCSRQTIYEHARQIEQRLQPAAPASLPAADPIPASAPAPVLDGITQRRLAVAAFAMGLSTRRIEDLLRVILPDEGPDHSTIGRRIAEGAKKTKPVMETLDAACIPRVRTLAVDEIFFGGDRPWSASSRRVGPPSSARTPPTARPRPGRGT